jgi:hypothetical protein
MKPIRITPKNTAAIEAALAATNGKAVEHTFTTIAQVMREVAQAEYQLIDLLGTKAHFVGAKYAIESGERVANAYKYSRRTTRVIIEWRATGAFLVHVAESTAWTRPDAPILTLTPEQDAQAAEHLRRKYRVAS